MIRPMTDEEAKRAIERAKANRFDEAGNYGENNEPLKETTKMTEQKLKTNLTQKQLDQIAELVTFVEDGDGDLRIKDVLGDVEGDVRGDVRGDVWGGVWGSVLGDVGGTIEGSVWGSVWGNVVGSVVGNVVGNVGGNVLGNVHGGVWGGVLS